MQEFNSLFTFHIYIKGHSFATVVKDSQISSFCLINMLLFSTLGIAGHKLDLLAQICTFFHALYVRSSYLKLLTLVLSDLTSSVLF
jgi:hypothetical protein